MNKILAIVGLCMVLQVNALTVDSANGKAKAVTCIACHGADGNSVVPTFPKIAGQSAKYLFKQLQDFKLKLRTDATMNAMVLPLSTQDMQDISFYFASQDPKPATQVVDGNSKAFLVAEKIYKTGDKKREITACIACHGAFGKGIPSAGFPLIAAQHSLYTAKQLKAFRQQSINQQIGTDTAQRINSEMMNDVSKSLTNQEIDALAAYIQALK